MSSRGAEWLAHRFELQAAAAVPRKSPLYQFLFTSCAADLLQGGPTWLLLRNRVHEPAGDGVAVRLLAAVHRLVLGGMAPALEAFYPSVGGQESPAGAWPAFVSVLVNRADQLDSLLDRPLQTNEVGRCSALLVGFSMITERTGLPVAMLEIGASAGLNQNWSRFRYQRDGLVLGPAESPVMLPLPRGPS